MFLGRIIPLLTRAQLGQITLALLPYGFRLAAQSPLTTMIFSTQATKIFPITTLLLTAEERPALHFTTETAQRFTAG
jgi:hypothetical protein